jgi:hypothetical protein
MSKPMKDIGARYFGRDSNGELNEYHMVIHTRSHAQAKRMAKAYAREHEYRLLETFEISETEREQLRLAGWYKEELKEG